MRPTGQHNQERLGRYLAFFPSPLASATTSKCGHPIRGVHDPPALRRWQARKRRLYFSSAFHSSRQLINHPIVVCHPPVPPSSPGCWPAGESGCRPQRPAGCGSLAMQTSLQPELELELRPRCRARSTWPCCRDRPIGRRPSARQPLRVICVFAPLSPRDAGE